MTDLIAVTILDRPEIKAAFSQTARTDLLAPIITVINQMNSLMNTPGSSLSDIASINAKLNAIGVAIDQIMAPINQPAGLANISILNLTTVQLLSGETDTIRNALNTVLSVLKSLKA